MRSTGQRLTLTSFDAGKQILCIGLFSHIIIRVVCMCLYIHYRYRNPNGNPNNEIISAISTLGSDELRLIHSPGFVGGTRSATAFITY